MVTYIKHKMSTAKRFAKKRRKLGLNATVYRRKKKIKVSVTRPKKKR